MLLRFTPCNDITFYFNDVSDGHPYRLNIFMCDKGSGFALQEYCRDTFQNRIDGDDSWRNFPWSVMFKYFILNSAMSKIGEDKYLITGGSTSEQIGVDIPHKYTQVLSRSER